MPLSVFVLSRRVTLLGAALGMLFLLPACSTRHWAHVAETSLPPPSGEKVLHTTRLIVHIPETSEGTQCVAYEKYHPICFYNIRDSLEKGLVRGLWPSFPEVIIGSPEDAQPSDYLLQVDVTLDALPPDDAGPGWSAGARSRFRLLREGKVLKEETLASRSRAHFPYGTPLGEGATEVIDATIHHVAQTISLVPETRPDTPVGLPQVASRAMEKSKETPPELSPPQTIPAARAKTENQSAPTK